MGKNLTNFKEMKKLWIDILTPKQVMMFGELAKVLGKEHELFITTREYRETNELLELKKINAAKVGRHGGKTLEGKLNAGLERMAELNRLIQKEKPDALVSLSSPEASRIAFGLKIPHVCVNDIPEAEAVARLTIPLASVIVTPKLIPKSAWLKYGIAAEKIVQYDALDPAAWLKNFTPDKSVLEKLKIGGGKPIITFRAEESFAAYLENANTKSSVVIPIVNELMKKIDANFVVLPRYAEQEENISRLLNSGAIIAHHAIDGPSLLAMSDIFIGGGGTMTLESALLGTPTISCRQFSTMYEDYAVKKGLVIKADGNAAETAEKILKNIAVNKKVQKEKAEKLMAQMEDPVEVIKKTVKRFL